MTSFCKQNIKKGGGIFLVKEMIIMDRIKKQIFIPCVINLCLCILCGFLIKFTSEIKYSFNNMSNNILEQWESNSEQYLDNFSEKILFDINSKKLNPYNQQEFNEYIKKNINYINMNKKFDQYYIIDQGISFKKSFYSVNKMIGLMKESGITLNEVNKKIFVEKYSDITKTKNININNLISDICSMTESMVDNDNNLSAYKLQKNIIDNIFEKNNVIEGTDKCDPSMYINKSVKNRIQSKYWISIKTIPSGKLGFLDEPSYVDNNENKVFKKITVVAISNSSDKLSNVHKNYKTFIYFVRVTTFVIFIILLLSILKIVSIFKLCMTTHKGD